MRIWPFWATDAAFVACDRSLCDVRARSACMLATGARRMRALPDAVAACPPRDDRRALRSLKVRP